MKIPSIKKEQLLLYVLSLLSILMVVGEGEYFLGLRNWYTSAEYTMKIEWVFILSYIIILRDFPPLQKYLKDYSLIARLLIFWSISIIISLVFSPLDIVRFSLAQGRLYQTFTHVLFFIFVWDFFKRWKVDYRFIFYSIIFSTLTSACYFVFEWHTHVNNSYWINRPPLHTNIRHTGYLIETSLGLMVAFLLAKQKNNIFNFVLFSFLWGFIFWTGGRASTIALFISFIILAGIMIRDKKELLNPSIIITTSLLLGLYLSEILSVYAWNGILNALKDSIEATSLNQFSSSRLFIWKTVLISLEGNWLFGLGSQGYAMMDNCPGNANPHNILLQFLIEWGIIGTVPFIILLIKAISYGIKLHVIQGEGNTSISLAAGTVVSILTVHSFVSGTYFYPHPSVYLAITLAIWILPSKKGYTQ